MITVRIVKEYSKSTAFAGIIMSDYINFQSTDDAATFISKVNVNPRVPFNIIDYDLVVDFTSRETPEILENPTGGYVGPV